MLRHLQGMVHLCVFFQLILDGDERSLCLVVGRAGCSNGNDADDLSKLIVDPVRKFAQEQSCLRRKSLGWRNLNQLVHTSPSYIAIVFGTPISAN
jgi:hypothetical protein